MNIIACNAQNVTKQKNDIKNDTKAFELIFP